MVGASVLLFSGLAYSYVKYCNTRSLIYIGEDLEYEKQLEKETGVPVSEIAALVGCYFWRLFLARFGYKVGASCQIIILIDEG